MAVDWQSRVWRYNRDHKTSMTEREVLDRVYERFGSLEKSAEYLLVDRGTLATRLRQWKIPYGKNRRRGSNQIILDGMKLKGRTAPDIARETGIRLSSIHRYAKAHGIKLKLVRGKRCRPGGTP